jgi:general secretion pathway protein A
MYESHFGLKEEPFSIAPDPRFMYMSEKHKEALAHLIYGLRRGGGFVVLTGEIGAGKTTVWRCFLDQLPSRLDVAYVVNPKLGVNALLTRVCEDLHVELPGGAAITDPIDAIHGHLLLTQALGRRALIVVDEAQSLSVDVLEQLRLLTNLVTSERKLVQVLLIGQPELRSMIEKPLLEPLAQRVVTRFHLPALPAAETERYIAHRMAVAGLNGELPFDAAALRLIHKLCGGVPRRINVLCDRALHDAHTAGLRRVDADVVNGAADAVFGRLPPAAHLASSAANPWAGRLGWLGAAGAVLAVGSVLVPKLTSAPAAAPSPAVVAAIAPAAAVAAVAQPASAAARPLPADRTPLAAAAAAAVPRSPVIPTPVPAVTTPTDTHATGGLEAAFSAASADESQAWRALASLWGASLGPGEPCALAPPQSLACFRGRGGLGLIRQLGRPGIVKLVDERGRTAHVLLTALGTSTATLRFGGTEHTVRLASLASAWRGEFSTFWRTPPGYRSGDPTGAARSPTTWLGQRFAQIDGVATAPADEAALKARIFAFQLAHDLEPDGLPGPLTLMQLNRAVGIEEPRLQGRPQ